MRYEDMINGLAEEMLEKIANEIEEEEVEVEEFETEEFEGEEVEAEEFEVEEEEFDEEELESLAEEMFLEELEKVAYGVEEELEKEAGVNFEKVRAAAGKAVDKVAPKSFKNAKANKELVEATLGNVSPHNPAVKAYKKEKAKLIGKAVAGTAGVAGAGAGAVALRKRKAQEKAAAYFEEAEFLKQAAEEAYNEALMMQDAAVALFNRMED